MIAAYILFLILKPLSEYHHYLIKPINNLGEMSHFSKADIAKTKSKGKNADEELIQRRLSKHDI